MRKSHQDGQVKKNKMTRLIRRLMVFDAFREVFITLEHDELTEASGIAVEVTQEDATRLGRAGLRLLVKDIAACFRHVTPNVSAYRITSWRTPTDSYFIKVNKNAKREDNA